jgi:hypothetical protein
MLERLGCSREVGLWLASGVLAGLNAAEPEHKDLDRVLMGKEVPHSAGVGLGKSPRFGLNSFHFQGALLRAFKGHHVIPAQRLLPLLTLMPVATLQWLSGIPSDRLLHISPSCINICTEAATWAKDSYALFQAHSWRPEDMQPGGDLLGLVDLAHAARTMVIVSSDLLAKLLEMCRALPSTAGSTDPCTGSSGTATSGAASSSGSSSSSSMAARSDRGTLMLLCQDVVSVLACGLGVSAESDVRVRLIADGDCQCDGGDL